MQSNRCKGASSPRLVWWSRMALILAALLLPTIPGVAQVK